MFCDISNSLQKGNHVKPNLGNTKPESTNSRFSVHIKKVMGLKDTHKRKKKIFMWFK